MELLGPIPISLLEQGSGRVSRWFNMATGKLKHITPDHKDDLHNVVDELKPHPSNSAFADFLLDCLHYEPHARLSARAALQHPWLTDPDPDDLDDLNVVHIFDK